MKELDRSGDRSEATIEVLAVLGQYGTLAEKAAALKTKLQEAERR